MPRAARTVDVLHVRPGANLLDPERVVVLEAADAASAFRRDDDRAVRGVDAVEGRRFRALEHGDRLDVVGVDVGRAVGEVDAAVVERERRVGASDASVCVLVVLLSIGRPSTIISGWLLLEIELTPRIVINDEAPGTPDVRRDVHAGDAPLQRVDEVLTLRLRRSDHLTPSVAPYRASVPTSSAPAR